MAELRIRTDSDEDHTLVLDGRPFTFGRGEGCDFVLDEQRASRRHCTFHPCGEGWRIEDEQSSNGTWLGGRPVLSARLQPGDEIEIGRTVITYEGSAVSGPAAPARPRRPRAPRKSPWRYLAVPAALALAAVAGVALLRQRAVDEESEAWMRYARTSIDIAELQSPSVRVAALERLARELSDVPGASDAERLAQTELKEARGGAGTGGAPGATPGGAGEDWRAALAGVDAGGDALPVEERRLRLLHLLERNPGVPEVAAEVRTRLEASVAQQDAAAAEDLARTTADADAALEAHEYGRVIELWTAWLMRAPEFTRDRERRIATVLGAARTAAADEARRVAEEHERLFAEGQDAAAAELVGAALERLRGTGYDQWLRLRCGRADGGATGVALTGAGESASSRELGRALRVMARADELARLKQYGDAAQRLREVAAETTDSGLRTDLSERAADLDGASALLGKLLERARSEPKSLSPLKLPGGVYRVTGATDDGLLLVAPRGTTAETRPLASLPGDALAALLERCALSEPEFVSAAIVLHDFDDAAGYVRWMRAALAVEETRLDVSRVHARVVGVPLPVEGFMPHPDKTGGVVTYDEYLSIKNAARCAEYRTEYSSLLAKLESSKQARSIAKVAEAYAQLEAARRFALELIFDTEKYFYPYRGTGREAEYAKVSQEVDGRVDKVFEAWASEASASPVKDAAIVKILERLDEIETEVAYLRGDLGELRDRVDAVARYLDQKLTIRTFWVTDDDRKLIAYNEDVMADNAAMETVAADPEREQVRITNEYRIMFGHRRALRINDNLVKSARGHSEDMGRLGFFDHFSPVPGKRTPSDRTRLAGYVGSGVGENIHMGSGSPQGAHDGWRHSSGHHRNMLDPSWVELGTGQSGRYWTQNFGYRSGDFGDFK